MRRPAREEGLRWLQQAEADLSIAEQNRALAPYLACFLSQQAAEKALKGLLYALGHPPIWEHSVMVLCGLAASVWSGFAYLKDDGAELDRLYIPTRYPDALPGGIPAEIFKERDAAAAISATRRIIDAVRQHFT